MIDDALDYFLGQLLPRKLSVAQATQTMLQRFTHHNAEHDEGHAQTGVGYVHAAAHRCDEHVKDEPDLIVGRGILVHAGYFAAKGQHYREHGEQKQLQSIDLIEVVLKR